MSYVSRYAELFKQQGIPHLILEGKLFKVYSRMVMPEGPSKEDFSVSNDSIKHLFKFFNSPLIRLTCGFSQSSEAGYYSMLCDAFVSVDEIKNKKVKYEINRAIRLCSVRKLNAKEIADLAYPIYVKAIRSYSNFNGNIPDENTFRKNILNTSQFEDIVHYWGVFFDNQLCGFATNYIYDKLEVNYSMIKYDPDFFSKGISYALIYRMNEYYLGNQGFEFATDGYTSLLHESNVQSFLQRNFDFYPKPIHLYLTWKFPFSLLIPISQPFSNVLAKFDPRFKAIYRLNSFNNGPLKSR
jgi:hypothetical protein